MDLANMPPPLHDPGRDSDEAENVRFRREHPGWWWITLVGPALATVTMLFVLLELRGADFVWQLLGTALATFFFFGRFVILGGSDGAEGITAFLTAGELFAMVVWMDVVVACVLAFHLGFMYRIPYLGPRVEALERDGEFILHSNRWMRRATFVGLIAFVAFPLAATGSVGGAIFGRLLGMSRATTFAGVVLGSLLGCGAMYLGAELLDLRIDGDNPWLLIGGVAVIAVLILLLNHRYARMKQRFFTGQKAAPPDP